VQDHGFRVCAEQLRESVGAGSGDVSVVENAGDEGDVVEERASYEKALEVDEESFWVGLVLHRDGGCCS
jgi:hypothetical protein